MPAKSIVDLACYLPVVVVSVILWFDRTELTSMQAAAYCAAASFLGTAFYVIFTKFEIAPD